MRSYQVTAYKTVEPVEKNRQPGPEDISGRTLFSLISAGTEVNGCYLNPQGWDYPISLGYAAVFEVEAVGEHVRGFSRGDLALCCGAHADLQICHYTGAIRLPDGMEPKQALFARMTAISMATLSRLHVHAGDSVLVVGLGAVGLLAMQAYARCGYRVSGMDPDPARADLAARLSGRPAWTALPEEAKGQFGLALECSGTQQGAMTCCDALRMGGELSLVGVPWRPTGDVHSYPLLNRIFYQYLTVYSGWEMNLPARPGRFAPDSQLGNMEQAIEWIHAGDIRVDGMEKICSWKELPRLYEAILNREEKSVSILLDWRDSSAG